MKKLSAIFFILLISCLYSQENKFEKFSKNTQQGTLYGINNKYTKEIIIPASYNQISDYFDGYFVAEKNNFLGLIDTLNQVMIPFVYKYIESFDVNRFIISSDGSKFFISNEKGNKLGNQMFEDFRINKNGIVQFLKNKKVGYLNNEGKEILEAKFDSGEESINDFIIVYTNKWNSFGYDLVTYNIFGQEIKRENIGTVGKYPLLFNNRGKLLFKGESTENIKVFENHSYAVASNYLPESGNTRYIFIDSEGKTIEYFDEFYGFHFYDDFIKIEKSYNGMVGVMNYEGKIAFPPYFKDISNFTYNNNKLSKVTFPDGEYFYMDKNLNCVLFDNKICPEQN